MARLSIHLLGPFQVTLDKVPVASFESDKVRALLAYLAVETDHPHRREALAGLLWPDSPERAARTNLRHVLANLRQAIGDRHASPPFLLSTHQTLQFNLESDYWLDVASFTASLQAYKADPQDIGPLEEAVSLYQGLFMAEFSLPDSAPYEEWLTLMREQLNRQAVEALQRLAQHYRQRGAYGQALPYAWRQLELEPWQEEAHQEVMRLLALTGQRSLALVQYETCRRLLAEGLGMEPAPETRALYEQIRSGALSRGELSRGAEEPGSRGENAFARTHNLPVQLTSFVGREKELVQIARRLHDPACRLLTLVGPGGSGKTRLALQAVQNLSETGSDPMSFRHGVYFVPLIGLSSPDFLASAIAEALNFTAYQIVEPRQQLLDYLREKELLLLLDNFEHLLTSPLSPPQGEISGGTTLLTDILTAAPGVKIMVTSREMLNLREEWLLPVRGMTFPGSKAVDQADRLTPLEAYSAVQLFRQCARQVKPGFDLAGEGSHVVRICRLVEGLPLGIELAAAWLRVLPCETITQELERGLDFLTTVQGDVPARHRSMRAVFDHSWRLLRPAERSMLRQLAVFRGGFTGAAAEAVTGAALAGLAGLADKSWLHVQPGGRYELHELVRQYCEEKLAGEHVEVAGETAEQVRQRHTAYYGAYLHRQMRLINFEQTVVANIMAEFGNLQAAWQWMIAQGDMRALLDMIISFYFIGEMLGWYHFIIRVLDHAITLLEPHAVATTLDPGRRSTAATLLCWIGFSQTFLLIHLGLLERARTCVERNLAWLGQVAAGDAREEMHALTEWLAAWLLHYEGQFSAAYPAFRKLLTFFQTATIDFSIYGHEAGAKFWQAHAYAALGMEALMLGEYAEAEQWTQQAIALREAMGEQRFRAFNLGQLARILLMRGDYAPAEEAVRAGLRLSQAFGDQIGLAFAHLAVGRVETALGRYALAQEHYQQSLAVGRESGNHRLFMDALTELGRTELALGHPEAAKQHCEEAIAAFVRLGAAHSNYVVAALLGLGWAALASHGLPAAKQCFRQALDACGRAAWETLEAVAGLAEVAAAEDQPRRAVELLAFVFYSPATSHTIKQRVGRRLQALANVLTPVAFTDSAARGRGRVLADVVAELAGHQPVDSF